MKIENFEKGLSLVELLIGIAILGVVSLMVGAVYFAHFRLFSNQSTSITTTNANRIALDEIINQIREAKAVTVLSSGITFPAGCSTVSGSNSIILALPPLDSNGDPFVPLTDPQTDSTEWDRMAYCVDSSQNLQKVIKPRTSSTPSLSNRTASTKIMAPGLAAASDPVPYGLSLTYLKSDGTSVTPDTAANAALVAQVTVRLKTTGKYYGQKQVNVSQDQEAKAVLRNK